MDGIVFRGTYRQSDGWGQAALDYLKAIKKTSLGLASCESITLSQHISDEIPQWITDTENNPWDENKSVVIDHVLPGVLEPTPKGVWMGYTETRYLQNTGWIEQINKYKMAIVATEIERKNLVESGVKIPVINIKMPIDLELMDSAATFPNAHLLENKFTFLYIGDVAYRKNLQDLIFAYHRGFHDNDNALLYLKVTPGSGQFISKLVNEIWKSMRLKSENTPNVIVDDNFYKKEELIGLQKLTQVFCLTSRGESTCRPFLESLYCGNVGICTAGIGACADENLTVNRVNSIEEYCLCQFPPLNNIYTADEAWRKINVAQLEASMKAVYMSTPRIRSGWVQKNRAYIQENHSYDRIAKYFSDVLSRVHI